MNNSDLADKSTDLLLHGRSHMFEAPTGWGKTVVGGVIAARVGQPTLIVVTKEDLMDQWQALADTDARYSDQSHWAHSRRRVRTGRASSSCWGWCNP